MIIECISCSKKFELKDELLPPEGSKVRCGACSEVWFFHPKKSLEENENLSQNKLIMKDTPFQAGFYKVLEIYLIQLTEQTIDILIIF